MGQFKNRLGRHITSNPNYIMKKGGDHPGYREKKHKEIPQPPRLLHECNCCGKPTNSVFGEYTINEKEKVSFCSEDCYTYYLYEILY